MYRFFLVLACVTLLFCGCQPKGVDVSSVTGTVTYQGQAVPGAIVSFIPKNADGRGASAQTDSAGKFVLVTQGAKRNGAVEGEYFVTVSRLVKIDEKDKPAAQSQKEFVPNAPPQKRYPTKNLLPKRYVSPETTPLSAVVKKKAKNQYDFVLDD